MHNLQVDAKASTMLVCSLSSTSENRLTRNKASFPHRFVENSSSSKDPNVVTKIRSGGIKNATSEDSKVEITCQVGSTMVYNSLRPYKYNSGSSDVLDCYIEDRALLFVCQHPTKINSSLSDAKLFTKHQTFHLEKHANLVLVDWYDCSEKSTNGEAVTIDNLIEVKMNNESVLSLISQEQMGSDQNLVAIGGSIIVRGERVRKASQQILSLPKFEPKATLTNIGVKRNRGSSSNILTLEELEDKKDDNKNTSNSSDKVFICYEATENDEGVFTLKFKASSLELGYAFVSQILAPLEKELEINPASLPWARQFDPLYHGKQCASLL